MKTKLFLPVTVLLVIGTLGLGVAMAQDGQTSEKPLRLSVEIYGGFAVIQPDDLNLLAGYYNAYPLFFYTEQYDYLHGQFENSFTYSSSRSGDGRLKTVSNGFPFGIRLKYVLSRSLSLSAGLEYIKENRLSNNSTSYQIDDRSQGLIQTTPQELEISYPDFFLGVSAWIPQIGVHLTKPLGKRWQVGGSLIAGPLLARCRSVLETQTKYKYRNGYWSENYYLLEMKGAGTGWSFDLSAELRLKLAGRLSFFITSGYAWRRAANIEGSGHNQSLALDSNATQDLIENSWQGRWRKKAAEYLRYWGEFSQTYFGNYFSESEATDNFCLDLSGIQLKAGFSWAF